MTEFSRDTFENYLKEAERNPLAFIEGTSKLLSEHTAPVSSALIELIQARCFSATNRWKEAENQALVILSKALSLNDDFLLAHVNLVLSHCAQNLNQQDKQLPYLEYALSSAKKSRDLDLIAEVLCHLGAYYQNSNDMQKTLEYFARAEKQLTNRSRPRILCKVALSTGSAYFHFRLQDKALIYLSRALEISTGMEEYDIQLHCLNNISIINMNLAQYKEARKTLLQGLDLCRKRQDSALEVRFLFNLATVDFYEQNYEAALHNFIASHEVADACGFCNPHYLMDLNSNMAGCYRFLDQSKEALDCLEAAIKLAEQTGNEISIQEMNVNKANYLCFIGEFKPARELLKKALRFGWKNKRYELLRPTYDLIVHSYEAENNLLKANKYLKEEISMYLDQQAYSVKEQAQKEVGRIESIIEELLISRDRQSFSPDDCNPVLTGNLIGKGPQHREMTASALLAAQNPNASVLLLGESGTGKDVLAHTIHANSIRAKAPFIIVNMASITESIMESEFFGHKKGAFTGAISDTKGFFLEANNGTLFLDEISEIPLSLQGKLLRALEARKISPVGSSKEIPIDTRIICSSNRDLHAMVKNNQFRLDLFYRLNTITINLPPLRKRTEDIPLLVNHFVNVFSSNGCKLTSGIDPSFIKALQNYYFPGNIRELKNIIEYMTIMHKGGRWTAQNVEQLLSRNSAVAGKNNLEERSDQEEIDQIINALQSCSGLQKEAAKLLGMSEATLCRRIKKYNLGIYSSGKKR